MTVNGWERIEVETKRSLLLGRYKVQARAIKITDELHDILGRSNAILSCQSTRYLGQV